MRGTSKTKGFIATYPFIGDKSHSSDAKNQDTVFFFFAAAAGDENENVSYSL